MKLVRFALIITSFAVRTFAQQSAPSNHATEQEVRALFQALHMQQLMTSTMKNMAESMTPVLEKTFADSTGMNEDDRKFSIDVIHRNMDRILGAEYTSQAMEIAVPIYAANLSSEEVAAATAFFSSPSGQSWISKSPLMQQQMLTKLQPIIPIKMDEMQRAVQNDITEHMKQKRQQAAPSPTGKS
ncbi:MAG: hypothetical protein NVS9B15_05960 [Acidobacteriaceae bacterium]